MTFSSLKNLLTSLFVFFSFTVSAQLSGTYTIDSATTTSGTNYQSFTAAVSALTTNGVSGAVTFNVKKGTYTEQISIGNISGASATKTITFKGLGSLTTITATPPTSKYPIIGFNRTSHVIIDSIKIEVKGSRGWGVHFMNKADSITIKNCNIEAPKLSACYGIVASSSVTSPSISASGTNGGEFITIQNNSFTGGNSAIFFKGTTGPLTTPSKKINYGTDLHFEGNEIINFRSVGIDVSYNHNVNIIGNTVSSTETTAGGALRFWDAGDNCNIIGNKFYISSNIANTRVVALSMAPPNGDAGVSTKPIIIANNFIQYRGSNTSAPTGLLLKNKAYLKVYHNTISIKNQGSSANCIWFDANNARSLNGIEVRNNILRLENSGSGHFMFNAAQGARFKSMVIDHNNFYAPSNYFSIRVPNGTAGTSAYTTLAAYKGSAYGNGALNVDPLFLSTTNLHATAGGINDSGAVISTITDDIDGDVRSTTAPDIGADEYTPGQIVCPGPTQNLNKCTGDRVKVGTSRYFATGTYTDTLVGSRGCDSIIITNLTTNQHSTGIDTVIACDSYKWINGQTYTTDNSSAKHTITNTLGCDSIVTLNLTILKSSSSTDTIVACNAYKWRNGITYSTSNTSATFKLVNAVGCDSIIKLNLTINRSSVSADIITACDSLKWIDGNTYTSSNRGAVDTLTNIAGCDSLVYLDLTINNSSTGSDAQTACALYKWMDGNTYTSNNNTANHIIANSKGCDSLITLNLTLNPVIRNTDEQVACDEYTWVNGVTYTANNTTAIDTFPGSHGCDSIVTLDLTINTVDTTTTTTGFEVTSNASNGSYQWIDCDIENSLIADETKVTYDATKNGNFAVIVTQNNCTDTSDCVEITGVGFTELETSSSIRIFPNPNKGTFMIDLGEGSDALSIQILNLQGQVIYESLVSESTLEVNLYQPKGTYLIKAQGEQSAVVQRLIIQ